MMSLNRALLGGEEAGALQGNSIQGGLWVFSSSQAASAVVHTVHKVAAAGCHFFGRYHGQDVHWQQQGVQCAGIVQNRMLHCGSRVGSAWFQ